MIDQPLVWILVALAMGGAIVWWMSGRDLPKSNDEADPKGPSG